MKSCAPFFVLAIALLAKSAYAGPSQWVEVRSPHFTVVSDANEKQARHVLDQLERMRWVFEKLFPKANPPSAEPIEVLAAKNGKTFQSVEPAPYLGKGQLNLAGYFLNTQDRNYVLVRLDAEEEQHPFASIYHEYTHLQFSSIADWLPLWLNEGTAEFFQNTQVRDKDVLVGQPDTNNILYLRQANLIPLKVLFKVDASSPYYHEEEKGSVFYAESWALTHYLNITDHDKGTHRLLDYQQLVSQHEDSVVAAEKAFGDLNKLESALAYYIHGGQYKEFVMNSAAAPIDESSYKAEPLTAVQADAFRAEILANVQREGEARELAASVLKADPQNVRARETMGELEARSGKLDAARDWYAQAVKLDPTDETASFYFASLSMQSGHIDDETIEPSLRKAIEAHPSYSPDYEALASYLAMRHKNQAEALSLIGTAVKLDPGNFAFRMNAASILAETGSVDDAIAVLGAAVRLAKNPSQVSAAQHQIDNLRDFKQKQAEMEKQRQAYAEQPKQSNTNTVVSSTSNTPYIVPAAPVTPKRPDEAIGPKHSVMGVIHNVKCSYPQVLEFTVQSGGKAYTVYNNEFTKIDLSVFGFTPKGSLNPCSDFDGMKARVQYAETADKTMDGKVVAVELRK
jgi:tetratricopeptide (TPR) repeat protein